MAKNKKTPPDIHWLYEASVQNVDTDIDFAQRVYNKHWKRKPITVREDFCGTAKLACSWVKRNKKNEAWGIDFHQPTLDWGIKYNSSELTAEQKNRVHLLCEDVLKSKTPPADLIFALNFSFCVFKQREVLRSYFKRVHESLSKEGLFVMDIYGGTEAVTVKNDETREIPGLTIPEGIEIPDFEYIWDQAAYNPINHDTTCHIHFNVPGFRKIEKAFTYEWRLWTLAELQEILIEAGFSKAEVYLHDFDDDGESDETFRLRKTYENCQGWVAYVVGVK